MPSSHGTMNKLICKLLCIRITNSVYLYAGVLRVYKHKSEYEIFHIFNRDLLEST